MITARSHLPAQAESALKIRPIRTFLPAPDFPPAMWTLGSSYDIFGDYAHAGSIIQSLFDWDRAGKKTKDGYVVPRIVTANNIREAESRLYVGESMQKLQTNFSASYSSGYSMPGLFAASFKSEFGTKCEHVSTHAYSIYQAVISFWKYAFDYKSPAARKLWTKEFTNAIQTYDPIDLFTNYGTHFLREAVIGGRLHFSSATDTDTFKKDTEFSATVKASCELSIGNLDASASVSRKESIETFNKTSQTHLSTSGGDPALAALIGTGGTLESNKQIYTDWLNSVRQAPVFVDFGGSSALIPIWELAPTQARRQELEQASVDFLRGLNETNTHYSDLLVEAEVVESDDSGNVPAPEGYLRDDHDLNRGAGGAYTYLCSAYKSVAEIIHDQRRPVVDLNVFVGNQAMPEGWRIVGVDLNRGAGGAYLYLGVKYGQPGQVTGGIRDVVVISGDRGRPAPLDYYKIPVDLNQGAGGDFIYICYLRGDGAEEAEPAVRPAVGTPVRPV